MAHYYDTMFSFYADFNADLPPAHTMIFSPLRFLRRRVPHAHFVMRGYAADLNNTSMANVNSIGIAQNHANNEYRR